MNSHMINDEVIVIADEDQLGAEATQHGERVDSYRKAEGLRQLSKAFARRQRLYAIVSQHDPKGLDAFQKSGYNTIAVNGNRQKEVMQFILQMNHMIKKSPPKHLIVVTTDPAFGLLCDQVVESEETGLSVWAPQASVPPELSQRDYNFRALEDLLPGIRVPKVGVFIDTENIIIGLEQRGWKVTVKEVVEAIKTAIESEGQLVSISAYADFAKLTKNSGVDIQRELAYIGVDPRYQVTMNGKNSVDMRIANDIRTLVEKDTYTPDTVDVLVLVSGDVDYRPAVETAKARGKRVVIVALQGSLSHELQSIASEVKYLDNYLTGRIEHHSSKPANVKNANTLTVLQVAAWLQANHYHWGYLDKVAESIAPGAEGIERIRRAIEDGAIVRYAQQESSTQSNRGEAITLSPDDSLAQGMRRMVGWLQNRIEYNLNVKKLPFVDSNFLANGMADDQTFKRLGIGQNRADAENVLSLAAEAGIVVRKRQPHPKTPERIITTWWLPENTPKSLPPEATSAQPSTPPGPLQPTGKADNTGANVPEPASNAETPQPKNRPIPLRTSADPVTQAA